VIGWGDAFGVVRSPSFARSPCGSSSCVFGCGWFAADLIYAATLAAPPASLGHSPRRDRDPAGWAMIVVGMGSASCRRPVLAKSACVVPADCSTVSRARRR